MCIRDRLGPDDLALKVEELRQLTKNKVPIQLKLGASKVYDDVRMAAKCDPDSIYLDGMEGSTELVRISLLLILEFQELQQLEKQEEQSTMLVKLEK